MNSQSLPRRQLLVSAFVALVIGAAITLMVVLPAEYAVDVTGVGRLLGLQAMGEAKMVADGQNGGGLVHRSHDRKPRSVKIDVGFKGKEELEYKAVLAQGEPMLYSWSVQGGPVYFEFHGDPTEGKWPKDYYQSYQIKESSYAEQGSFVAPFAGNHGWYFKNLSEQPATVTLEVTGYYTKLGRVETGGATAD